MTVFSKRFSARSIAIISLALPMAIFSTDSATAGGLNRGGGAPPQFFFGLRHTATGQAILDTGSAGQILISNIGSSGNDGVSITCDQLGSNSTVGWAGEIDFGQAGALPSGMGLMIKNVGNVSDSFDVSISETGGGHGAVGVNVTSCPSCTLTVAILQGEQEISAAEYVQPFPAQLATGDIGSQGNDGVVMLVGGRKADDDVIDFTMRLPTETDIALPGLAPVPGDGMRIRLNGLPPGTPVKGTLSVVASNTGPITINGEALLAHELTHVVQQQAGTPNSARMRGVGDLNLDGRPDIVVANIGSSGNDGVDMFVRACDAAGNCDPSPASRSFSVETDFGPAGGLSGGDEIDFIVDAHATSGATYVFTLTVSATAGGLAAVSYAPCNEPGCCEPCCPCAGVVVEAFHHGILVDQVEHDAPPATIAEGEIGSSSGHGTTFFSTFIDSCANLNDDRLLLGLRNYDPTLMTLTGSAIGPVMADELRATPRSGSLSVTIEGIARAGLRAANVGSFTILDGEHLPSADAGLDIVAHGLRHTPFHNTHVLSTPAGLRFECMLDGTGVPCDVYGGSIHLGEADGLITHIGTDGDLPSGGEMLIRAYPRTEIVKKLWLRETSGHVGISFEDENCTTCPLEVELLLDGVVVGTTTYMPPYPQPIAVTGTASVDGYGILCVGGPRDRTVVQTPVAGPITLDGGPSRDADCVTFRLNGLPPGVPVDGITIVDVSASGLPGFVLNDERPVAFGNVHSAQGQAQMCGARDNHLQGAVDVIQVLRVFNIGSSGQDGVAIEPPDEDCDGDADDADLIDVTLEPVQVNPGGQLVIHAHGTGGNFLGRGPSAWDFMVQLPDIPGESENDIIVDFGDLGSTTYTTEIYLDDVLVTSQPGQTGPVVAHVPNDSRVKRFGIGITQPEALLGGDSQRVKVHFHWDRESGDDNTNIRLPNGQTYVGDELRVINENPTLSAEAITGLTLLAAGIEGDGLTIIDETVIPSLGCPADLSNADGTGPDGTVNVFDLFILLGNWNSGGPGADLAPPTNVVDVFDLFILLEAWGNCQ